MKIERYYSWTFASDEFATYLKLWRKQNDLTQDEVGKLADCSGKSISTFERNAYLEGFEYPSMTVFIALCNIMDCDPRQFWALVPTHITYP